MEQQLIPAARKSKRKDVTKPTPDATTNARTIDDVRDHLLDVFNRLRSGEMEAKEAVEINNTAGKIMTACKVQLAYHAMRNERPYIEFLDCAPSKAI